MMDRVSLDALIEKHGPLLGPASHDFLRRVYSAGLELYLTRVRQYGFVGLERVLDAGCGFGQWSLALAESNAHVNASDLSSQRVAFLREAVAIGRTENLQAVEAPLDHLPYEGRSFDGVFCYGVIFLTAWRESLAELARVLKPGGLLYVNANGFGWYKHLWYQEHNRGAGYDPKALAARTLANTLTYDRGEGHQGGVDVIIEPDALVSELTKLGFHDIQRGAEGTLGAGPHRPFFQGEYLGDLGVYEVLCRKQG